MPAFRTLLATAIALFLAAPAFAQTTYRLVLDGEIDHLLDCWETTPQCSGPRDVQYAWGGILTVVVDTAADGSFTGPDLESVNFTGNVGSFTLSQLVADPFYAVTVTDGQVSSLQLHPFIDTLLDVSAWDDFSGLSVIYYGSGGHHYGGTSGTATLSPIPEPAPAALLLAGLAMGAALRRRQACANGQRGLTSNE
jgi:hypothetical protein